MRSDGDDAVVVFGPFTLDVVDERLWKHDEERSVGRDKAFTVLVRLVKRAQPARDEASAPGVGLARHGRERGSPDDGDTGDSPRDR